jgi:apolipoprotein C-III
VVAGQELRAGVAQLCSLAGAEEVEGSLLLGSVQGYMEQASKTVQDALSSVQESDIAVVAR